MKGTFRAGYATSWQTAPQLMTTKGNRTMIRYAAIALATLGAVSAASAFEAQTPAAPVAETNVTVIVKNSPFPVLGPLVFEECAVEDCSDATF